MLSREPTPAQIDAMSRHSVKPRTEIANYWKQLDRALVLAMRRESFDRDAIDAPADLQWSAIEAALRSYLRADATWPMIDDEGREHACDVEPGGACEDACIVATDNDQQPSLWIYVSYERTDEWSEAEETFLAAHRRACLWANSTAYVNPEDNAMLPGPERDEQIASDEDGGSLDRPEDLSDDDLDDTAREHLDSDAREFFASNADLLCRAVAEFDQSWEQLGHDFALTRAGHGAGFWDRGTGEVGEALSRASKPHGNIGIMVPLARDEDGNLHGPTRALTSGDIHT